MNIGKTKLVANDAALDDYAQSAELLAAHADYLVVNVSSPNTPGLRDLQAVDSLRPLLGRVRNVLDINRPDTRVPLLLKIAPDLADDDIDALDQRQVEWAVATRMRAHADLLLIPGMKSNPVDPMSIDRTITKLGIDATLPVGTDPQSRVPPGIPEEARRRLDARWDGLMSGPATR